MEYLDMLRFACIFMGGTLAIAILVREAHVWWEERKSLKAARQWKAQYYAEMARDAVQEAEQFLRETRRRP